MAFQDLTGDSGFTSDSEGANANLDITMSEDSARNLWDVQAAIQQIATDFQTAVRAASDFNSYLISIRETGQTVQMPSLGMDGGESGNMSYAGGRVDTQSVPLMQSEMGMASRIGEMEENASGVSGGAMAARATNTKPVDVNAFVGQMANAGWMASMTGQQQHGQSQMGPGGFGPAGGGPLDPQVIGAMHRGSPHSFAAGQLISQGVASSQQFLRGGGVGGFASAAGRLGTYGAIGYAGYQLVDAGLQTYAQSRAMALTANNSDYGAGWGFGQRVSQAGMAMSPFVSQEEAAQIYSSAISQGWASQRGGFESGNFGQAVDFMYTAAKDYNMDPGMSSKMLQTNALGAGQSINSLSQQLLTLKQVLDGTGVSTDAASSGFASFTGMLISSGANPATAATIAGGALKGYSGNNYLGPSGRGMQIVMDTLGAQQSQNVLAGLTGTLPGASLSGEHGVASTQQLQKLTARFAQQVLSMSGTDMDEKAAMFVQLYNGTFGTNITQQDAMNMIAENAANPDLLTKGQKEYLDKGKMAPQQQRNAVQAWWNGLDDWEGWASSQTGNKRSTEEMENTKALINSYKTYSPEVNELLYSSGDLSKVVLYGPDGQPVMSDGKRIAGANISKWFSDSANYDKFAAADSKYYIQDEAGDKFNSQNIGVGGSNQSLTSDPASSDRTVYITLSDQAKQWFSVNKDKLELSDGKY